MTIISKDTLWKGIIEDLFEDFSHYFFPDWSAKVADFSRAPEFLDKELDEIYPQKHTHKRYADKLVKVYTKEQGEQWILIHVEVQGYKDENFAQRMFTYFHRILDRYKQRVMTLAILTDDDDGFLPQEYVYQYEQTRNTYEFTTFKVLQKNEDVLNIPGNPFSIVMLTAKKALLKRNLVDSEQLVWKKALVLALREAEYSDNKIRRILHFIRFYVRFNEDEYLLDLDEEIQTIFKQRQNMGIEEAIREEYRKQGLAEGKAKGRAKGKAEGEQQVKIRGIKKALQKGTYGLEEIAYLFEVSQDFILKVQKEEL